MQRPQPKPFIAALLALAIVASAMPALAENATSGPAPSPASAEVPAPGAASPAPIAEAPSPAEAASSAGETTETPPQRRALAVLAPSRLRQGDPLLAWIVAIEAAAPAVAPTARLLGPDGKLVAEAPCFELPAALGNDESGRPWASSGARPAARVFGALFPLPTSLAPGGYSIAAAASGGEEAAAGIDVEVREFSLEEIKLDEANTALRARPTKRQLAEAKKLYALLGRTNAASVFADFDPFSFPVAGGFKSAGFGDRRRYLLSGGGSETSEHAGIDWGVVKGTAVRACERGRVALVADRELTGITVVIEHLPGLYSIYFHLSAAKVWEGEFVERGQAIALSGSTGLSTGPHLHWELRARGQAVDPEFWLQASLLDKDAIKATIDGLIEGR
jgi:murein DD-endopeptidase MepM/ murein hydrolase activator NlpD